MKKTIDVKPPRGKVLVALSGGADSVALLRLLHEQGCNIEALHCNFHLRDEESTHDEEFVIRLCKKLSIRLHVQHFDTKVHAQTKGISIEMAARELRYGWFERMRQELSADSIAVAHHQDDQAETVMLNLIRGTGIRGLAGMKERNRHIIRPLLHLSKDDILQYLDSIGQDYVTDSTNMERDALRNRIRLDVLPMLKNINPQAAEHIAQAAEHVRNAIPYYLKGIAVSHETNATTLHERLYGMGFTIAQEADILQHIGGQSGKVFESATHRVLCNRSGIIVEAKEQLPDAPPTLHYEIVEAEDALAFIKSQPLTPDYAYLDADKVELPLTLRHPKQGDRFQPFGIKNGTRLVSDFLTDLHTSLFDKQRQWLACQGEQIVWVVGKRIDNRLKVTANTHRVLVVCLESHES